MAWFLWVFAGMPLAVASAESKAGEPAPLTKVAQILALTPSAFRGSIPVALQGIVTLHDPGVLFFVQDETGGIFVHHTGPQLAVKAGQHVRVTGIARPGRFSPIVDSPTIETIESTGTVQPRQTTLAQIFLGGLDAQWVETTGVIRHTEHSAGSILLTIADPPHRIRVWAPEIPEDAATPGIGARVAVRGVIVSSADGGRLHGIQIFCSSKADIRSLDTRTTAPFSRPVLTISELATYAGLSSPGSAVRLQGIVTLSLPELLYVQDGSGAVEVRPQARLEGFQPGAKVDIAGYLGPISERLHIEDALVRQLGQGQPPTATRVNPKDISALRHDSHLLEFEAHLLGHVRQSNVTALALESDGRLLTALVRDDVKTDGAPELPDGSRVRLTGVATFRGNPPGESLTMLLRSGADLQVLRTATALNWLTNPFIVVAALGTALALVVALWYIYQQRLRNLEMRQAHAALQAEMHESDLQLRRSIEERERIGRDLHDDIIQSIYAVGLSLEDCKRVVTQSPETAQTRLQAAIQTLNHTISSVRGFISGLEPTVLNGREFRTALKSLALTSGGSGTQFSFEVDAADANCLTSTQATQLLNVAKEAISNALRHARASTIVISLVARARCIRLEVRDDGVGCDPALISRSGHGLRNISARARDLGGEMEMISAPGQGCRIVVSIPQPNVHESS